MFPASFGYVAAHSVGEALELLTQHGEDAKLLAGGHSLIPAMKLRLASPRTLIDLGTVPGLRGVHTDGNTLVIGALTVHTDVASAELVQKHLSGSGGRGIGDRRCAGAQSRHHRRKYRPRRSGSGFSRDPYRAERVVCVAIDFGQPNGGRG